MAQKPHGWTVNGPLVAVLWDPINACHCSRKHWCVKKFPSRTRNWVQGRRGEDGTGNDGLVRSQRRKGNLLRRRHVPSAIAPNSTIVLNVIHNLAISMKNTRKSNTKGSSFLSTSIDVSASLDLYLQHNIKFKIYFHLYSCLSLLWQKRQHQFSIKVTPAEQRHVFLPFVTQNLSDQGQAQQQTASSTWSSHRDCCKGSTRPQSGTQQSGH